MNEPSRSLKLSMDIKKIMMGGYPIVFAETQEEEHFYQQLRLKLPMFTAGGKEGQKEKFFIYDPVNGLRRHSETIKAQLSLEELFDFLEKEENGIFVLKDIHRTLTYEPTLSRRLVTMYHQFNGKQKVAFLPAPRWNVVAELVKLGYFLEYGLPDEEEVRALLNNHLKVLASRDWMQVKLTKTDFNHIVVALRGMTATEIEHLIKKICYAVKIVDHSLIKEFFAEKRLHTRISGCLEFVEPTQTLDEIGGLGNLKDWLTTRKELFSEEAAAKGIRAPKGLLIMGISGCGKSLSVKSISDLWGLPLFRLDMGRVFGGAQGKPEDAFFSALKVMEEISPAILWLDEMEMVINTKSESETTARIFAGFLTWMQEKKASVFVAATANRIDLLPAEVLRKGRFDQIFFVDLPNEVEREHIFRVHLKKRNLDPEAFPIPMLAISTNAWNGAEIESAIESAVINCFNAKKEVAADDIWSMVGKIVPLAKTMSEQIKYIKDWAMDRALSATKKAQDDDSMVKEMTMHA